MGFNFNWLKKYFQFSAQNTKGEVKMFVNKNKINKLLDSIRKEVNKEYNLSLDLQIKKVRLVCKKTELLDYLVRL